MWAWIGLGSALAGAASSFLRSRARSASFYEHDVYAMTEISHRRFAWTSLAFAALFACSAFIPALPAVPILAIYTVLLILYAATFLRGATGEDE